MSDYKSFFDPKSNALLCQLTFNYPNKAIEPGYIILRASSRNFDLLIQIDEMDM